ncbi:hypothetical protein MAA_11674 [Metarhizium robertsii ARSEF 23]|uniref:Uncharacterized protein n=1 Tax=Metarhizium robertsii (strain ARSEF 23 / ATCC MYA-3075) TaxID=655844 RepID=A0A0B2XFL6_METRA|nr:uncharacterized protein MAA_11674 [Metarhizium robertsii ARSEF 23]KHO10716.1 hypothetical protein MAA_11674 [Metarhizium robertsii ARSEF 23]
MLHSLQTTIDGARVLQAATSGRRHVKHVKVTSQPAPFKQGPRAHSRELAAVAAELEAQSVHGVGFIISSIFFLAAFEMAAAHAPGWRQRPMLGVFPPQRPMVPAHSMF